MQVTVIEEHGYESALRGMAYSFRDRADRSPEEWFAEKRERANERAPKLAPMNGGHNKFLESMQVWIDLECSRAMWSEMDTYRAGMTKQSESTMHTLAKRAPTEGDFEPETPAIMIAAFKEFWLHWKDNSKDIAVLKCALPEGFLQRRVLCTNYMTLRNIVRQRKDHRLKYWPAFCRSLVGQLQHPEFFADVIDLREVFDAGVPERQA